MSGHTATEKPHVWLGLRQCGCAIAVSVDSPEPVRQRDLKKFRTDLARNGFQVVRATWDEWQTKYRMNFLSECDHEKAAKAEGR